jgi:hypothetical protein
MARREDEPTERVHLWLFSSDKQWLIDHFGESVGFTGAVRKIVRAYRRRVEQKAQDLRDKEEKVPVSLEEPQNEHSL